MATFKLSFLGPAQFTYNDTPVELKSVKGAALLAYLAVTGAAHSRDHLIDLLWPDSLPEAARKNLRNTLWAIRKALSDDPLQAETERIVLNKSVEVDVQTFEKAVAALQNHQLESLNIINELYRGPLLDGLALTDAPDFELWLTTERERLGQLYLRALEASLAFQRTRQDWQGVIATARRALAADNLQEPIHRAMMEAHARLGERAEALRQYDILQTTLAQELGVEPLPDTRRLRQAILNGALEQTQLPQAAPPVQPRPPSRPTATPFVGRQAELAALDRALAAATGSIQIVLISGELGIGKSRLWQEWSAKAASWLTVLETRCLDTTQALPFAPLTGLFRQPTCARHLLGQNSLLAPVWLAELARLLPEIKQHHPALPLPPNLPPEEEQRRIFEALTQILLVIESRPILLFIDDLHWIDQASLDWLVYLVDRLQQYPLLLAGAYRPNEASPQLSRVAAAWSRQGLLSRLPLTRLTLAETTNLLAALGGNVGTAEQLHARSAGNPYFLIELSHANTEDTPPNLAELIRARLNRLPDAARQVLQAAAVLDTGFDFAILRRTSGRGEEETLNALDALLEAAVLLEHNHRYEFANPLAAAVVRGDLSLARRSFLHRRAAEAMEAVHAQRLETIAGQLAGHYAQAGRPAQAAHYTELAAARALKLTAATEAATLYKQALRFEDTPGRRLGLGQALVALGEQNAAREELQRAGAGFEQEHNLAGAGRAYLELATSYLASGQGQQVLEWANKAVTVLGSPPNPALHASVHHLLAAGGSLAGRPLAEGEAHLLEAIQLATANNLPELAGAGRFELGNLQAQRGDLQQAIESFATALATAQAGNDLFRRVLAHNNLAYHAMLAGQLTLAEENIETALALAEKHALFAPRQYLYSTRGEIALVQGAVDQAKQWFEQALIEASRNNNHLQAANIRANLGLAARERGDLDEALLLLEEARAAAGRLTGPHLQIQIDLWLAELFLQREEQTAARQALERAQIRLMGGERRGLQAWANRLKARLDVPLKGIDE